jgi:hypothetical protein
MIDAKFPFCPHCGGFRQNVCRFCRKPVEPEWMHCALCGKESPTGTP